MVEVVRRLHQLPAVCMYGGLASFGASRRGDGPGGLHLRALA